MRKTPHVIMSPDADHSKRNTNDSSIRNNTNKLSTRSDDDYAPRRSSIERSIKMSKNENRLNTTIR